MKKNLSTIYSIAVIIALVVLGAWSAWDIYRLRASNSEAAQVNVTSIKSQVQNSFSSGMSASDSTFKEMIRDLFRDNPDLEILTLYSNDPDAEIEFHYGRDNETTLINRSEDSDLSMKDLPEYKYNQLMKTKITDSLSISGRTGMELDLIYTVVDRQTIYNILIRLLIVVVVLFFTTLFMIFTVSRRPVEETALDDGFQEDFGDDTNDDEEMSLDWDQEGFNDESSETPQSDDLAGLTLDDDDFGDFDLGDTDSDSDFNFDDVSSEFATDDSFEEVSDDFDFSEDTGLSDDLDLDTEGTSLSDELDFDTEDSSLSDELDFDTEDTGLSDELDFDTEDTSLSDELDFDTTDSDISDDLDFDTGETDLSEELDMSDDTEDFSFDDLDIDSDIPEEEDLLAMDHEVSPTAQMDDDFEEDFSDEPSLYSPKSGVSWESFIDERLNLELDRAANNDQDLVMGLIRCESLTDENYKIFADQLKEDFNYPDMIFEYKENGFAIIVPQTDLDEAINTLEAFTGKEQEQYGEINVGISSRNGRIINGSRIFMEAENALHKAEEDMDKNIVGFRSDPDKFREYLSKK